MAGAEVVVSAWKQWGLQALVLISYTLQVALLILAELRQRIDSGVLRALVWSAYLLADSTAIYVLGHLSLTVRSREHELMAFWAPFLLLHLGGQDNITAYAVEDNGLWLRHLQMLGVQVAAAAYVLYESSIIGDDRLLPATVLMFVVGVVKYGERVWALRCAGTTPSGNNYRSVSRTTNSLEVNQDLMLVSSSGARDKEALLLIAHRMLDLPKELLYGGLPYVPAYQGPDLDGEEVYSVIEMQLSLMHDVFYTKSGPGVMHTWCGICIRVLTMLATAVSLLLFNLLLFGRHQRKLNGYGRVDVAVTYVLLVGALALEITSLLRAMFSSWTCPLLLLRWGTSNEERNRWNSFLGRVVVSLRRKAKAADWGRGWSGSMGQLSLLKLCARSRASRLSKIATWMGLEDWWNTLSYTWSIPVSASMEKMLVKQVLKSAHTSELIPDHINNSRGRAALKNWGLFESLNWSLVSNSEDCILIWHIATDIYLFWYQKKQQQQDVDNGAQGQADLAKAVQELSNYMVFLIAAHPYLLSKEVNRNSYLEMCFGLTSLECGSAEDLAKLLWNHGEALNGTGSEVEFPFTSAPEDRRDSVRNNETLRKGSLLAARLISHKLLDSSTVDILELIAQVWVEMLCYAGMRCDAYSHTKRLSKGGELITIATLLVTYMRKKILKDRTHQSPDGTTP